MNVARALLFGVVTWALVEEVLFLGTTPASRLGGSFMACAMMVASLVCLFRVGTLFHGAVQELRWGPAR